LKFDIKTPGRGEEVKMFTKADFNAKTTGTVVAHEAIKSTGSNSKQDKYANLADQVIAAYGGPSNIKNVDACITKLRVQVGDPAKVDRDMLMELGARGVIKPSPQSVYAVFGNEADIIKNKMNDKLFSEE
jgi:glucose-like phosphotransferase system IIB component